MKSLPAFIIHEIFSSWMWRSKSQSETIPNVRIMWPIACIVINNDKSESQKILILVVYVYTCHQASKSKSRFTVSIYICSWCVCIKICRFLINLILMNLLWWSLDNKKSVFIFLLNRETLILNSWAMKMEKYSRTRAQVNQTWPQKQLPDAVRSTWGRLQFLMPIFWCYGVTQVKHISQCSARANP